MPAHLIPQAVVLTATLLMAAFLVLLQLPAAVSPMWLPWLAAAWGLTFPVALLLQASLAPSTPRAYPLTLSCAVHARLCHGTLTSRGVATS